MTKPQRLALKIHALSPRLSHAQLEAAVPLFHRYIQKKRLPGLLLDVADYAHVPDGPGVILIGHDVDYGIDQGGGKSGLLVTLKRNRELALAELARLLFRTALAAVTALESDRLAGFELDLARSEVRVPDRLALSNDAAGAEVLGEALRPLLTQLFGSACRTSHASASDPRQQLALAIEASGSLKAAELLAKLGGPAT
jgi:hypothetical protein